MATATKKTPVATSPSEAVHSVSGAGLAFLTYRDNGGNYHWEVVDANGGSLARSQSFLSRDEAERGARKVREGAHTASFEPHTVKERHTLAA